MANELLQMCLVKFPSKLPSLHLVIGVLDGSESTSDYVVFYVSFNLPDTSINIVTPSIERHTASMNISLIELYKFPFHRDAFQ